MDENFEKVMDFIFKLRDKRLKQMNQTDSKSTEMWAATSVCTLDDVYGYMVALKAKNEGRGDSWTDHILEAGILQQ